MRLAGKAEDSLIEIPPAYPWLNDFRRL